MAPGNFFARVVQYLVNDALVKVLANNRAFQQFAVRSSEQAKALSKNAEEAARAIANSPTITEARKEATQVSTILQIVGITNEPSKLTKIGDSGLARYAETCIRICSSTSR